ncbi:hypothetical protein ACOMHN_020633 [Nucella lapillus]
MYILGDDHLRNLLRKENIRIAADLTPRQREEVQFHQKQGKTAYFKNGKLFVQEKHQPNSGQPRNYRSRKNEERRITGRHPSGDMDVSNNWNQQGFTRKSWNNQERNEPQKRTSRYTRQRQYDYDERNNNTWRSHTASQRQKRHQNDKDSMLPVPWQSEYSWNQQAMFDRNCTAHPHHGTTEETSQPFMTQAPMYDTEEHYAHAASYRHSYNDWYQQNPDIWNDWHHAHYIQHVSATNLYQSPIRENVNASSSPRGRTTPLVVSVTRLYSEVVQSPPLPLRTCKIKREHTQEDGGEDIQQHRTTPPRNTTADWSCEEDNHDSYRLTESEDVGAEQQRDSCSDNDDDQSDHDSVKSDHDSLHSAKETIPSTVINRNDQVTPSPNCEAFNEACDAAARSSEATASINAAMDDTTVDACTSSKNRDGNSSLKNTSVDHVNDCAGEEIILPDYPLQPQDCACT